MKAEGLFLAVCRTHVVDKFQRGRFSEFVVDSEGTEIVGSNAWYEAAFHSASQHLVDDGDFLDEPQRMVKRHDVAHRSYAHSLGASPCADRIERG